MAAKDLIALARAYFNLPGISADPIISALITAASDAIIKYCRRDFNSKNFDEFYNGHGDRRLLLRQYPIQTVQSVRYRPVTVLKIINADTTTNEQARVRVTSEGLTLCTVASGVPAAQAPPSLRRQRHDQAPTDGHQRRRQRLLGHVVGDSTEYALQPVPHMSLPSAKAIPRWSSSSTVRVPNLRLAPTSRLQQDTAISIVESSTQFRGNARNSAILRSSRHCLAKLVDKHKTR
jgi:hypothetical protein